MDRRANGRQVDGPESGPDAGADGKRHRFLKFDFKEMPLGTKVMMGVFSIIVCIMLFIYAWTFFVDETLLTNIILKFFVNPVQEIGTWGYLLFILLMFVQTIIAPIPSELVQMTAGMIWGFALGSVLGFVGIVGSATVSFWISRRGGRAIVEGTVGANRLRGLDLLMRRYGVYAVMGMRAVPFIPFDVGSYAAGLVKISWRDYMIGTTVGAAVRSVFYAYIGSILFPKGVTELTDLLKTNPQAFNERIAQEAPKFNIILFVTLASIAVLFALFQFVILPLLEKRMLRKEKDCGSEALVEGVDSEPSSD